MNRKKLFQEEPQTLDEIFKKAIAEVESSEFKNLLNVSIINEAVFGPKSGRALIFEVKGEVSNEKGANLKKLKFSLMRLFDSYERGALMFNAKAVYEIGEKIPILKDLHSFETDKVIDFQTKAGLVTLIDFWATWCGPCQKPMAHNQDMLQRNSEKWKDKAEIVGISIDEDKSSVEERINDKNWTLVRRFQASAGWNSPSAQVMNVTGIPAVFLIDKQGRIRYQGHPSGVDMEAEINKLIEEKDDEFKLEKKEDKKLIEIEESKNDKSVVLSIGEELKFFEKFEKTIKDNIETLNCFAFNIKFY